MDRRVAPAAAIVVMAGQKARSAVFAPAVPAIHVLLAAVHSGTAREGRTRNPDTAQHLFFGFRVR